MKKKMKISFLFYFNLFIIVFFNFLFFLFLLIPNNTQEAQVVIKVLYKYAIDLKEGGKRLKALVYIIIYLLFIIYLLLFYFIYLSII